MGVAAVWRLGNELPHLLFDATGAHDLRLRHWEVHRWFAGMEMYGEVEHADYPPASYVVLWPLLGWVSLEAARWLWALTALGALAWLGLRAAREAGASTMSSKLLLILLPFSVYASSATLALGQLVNHVLPLTVAGVLLLRDGNGGWRDDLTASVPLVAALVKPPISAPFFWIVCFVPRRLRPIALVVAGYAALTLLALAFREEPLATTLFGWMDETPQAHRGHTNLHKWLTLAGLREWLLFASLLVIAGLGIWVRRNRGADVWVLLGVCAIIAQFWIHHRLYDHLLLIVPMIALFRIARYEEVDAAVVTAGLLFALMWLTLHLPASLLARPSSLAIGIETAQSAVWLTVLAFLVVQARSVMPRTRSHPAAGTSLIETERSA